MTDTAITPAENTGFKGIWVTLYQRVILSYKSTLIGMAVLAASVITDQLVASPNKVISLIGGVIAAVLAMYKAPTVPKAE
jgi:hypothetical protein